MPVEVTYDRDIAASGSDVPSVVLWGTFFISLATLVTTGFKVWSDRQSGRLTRTFAERKAYYDAIRAAAGPLNEGTVAYVKNILDRRIGASESDEFLTLVRQFNESVSQGRPFVSDDVERLATGFAFAVMNATGSAWRCVLNLGPTPDDVLAEAYASGRCWGDLERAIRREFAE